MKREKQLPALPLTKGKAAPITSDKLLLATKFSATELFGLTNIQNFHFCEVK